ncbi:unnamed protein product [Kluyveromyces dobzhanskii CBS 2104]|uniref:WGS project CCBQ000000000 data, contig 00102 n=1 Tax=Kluyveromyces dobzhanskii CBS 2104 TaxID=1427455 RepID=A0A0A8L7A5_9SACH|nr:unnamed protein product [Kluyveromyces dobzhanskii CBS 2104]
MTIDQRYNIHGSSDRPRVHQHYMMNYLKLFDAKVSINHWQLRNCITVDTVNPGSVYYIFDHSIRSLDTRSLAEDVGMRKRRYSSSVGRVPFTNDFHAATNKVAEFPFKPRSFNEKNGLIVCGGHIGNDDNGYIPSRPMGSYDGGFISPEERSMDINCVKIANADILSDHTAYSNTRQWKGIISLHNKNTNISITCKLGQYINNCVELYESSNNQFDLYTCNNDGHLYQCEINNSDFILKRRYADLKFALNNTAISHDGKTMCVTGDSNKLAMYKRNELTDVFSLNYDSLSGGQTDSSGSNAIYSHKRIPRYALPDNSSYVDHIYELPGADNGFFTSFGENDMMMATVFQNGNCYVYDVRNMESPLTEIRTTRSQGSVPQSGAFRICKFSEGMEDLLFISEHQQRVHVIDTRNFMNRQVIMVPYKYKGSGVTEDDPDSPLAYEHRSWHDTSASAERRRNSEPFSENPYITMATKIPIQHLQPTILPYSSVSDSSYASEEDLSGQGYLEDEEFYGAEQYQSETAPDSETNRNDRTNSNFTVRRYSTSSRALSEVDEEPSANIDPTIMGVEVPSHEDTTFATFPPTVQTLGQTYNDISTASIPAMRPFQMPSRLLRRRPRNHTAGRSTQDLNPEREECNISGIEWLRDQEGSSLVIGTDYGIIKWNINYWARRSFPSYDFC